MKTDVVHIIGARPNIPKFIPLHRILESNGLVLLFIENETESVTGSRLKRTTKYYIYY